MKLTIKINPKQGIITLNDKTIRWDEFEGDWRIDNEDATYSFNHLQDAYNYAYTSIAQEHAAWEASLDHHNATAEWRGSGKTEQENRYPYVYVYVARHGDEWQSYVQFGKFRSIFVGYAKSKGEAWRQGNEWINKYSGEWKV
jgi:hypothetical protein